MYAVSTAAFVIVLAFYLYRGIRLFFWTANKERPLLENEVARGRRRGTIRGACVAFAVGSLMAVAAAELTFGNIWRVFGVSFAVLGLVGLALALAGKADSVPDHFRTEGSFVRKRVRNKRLKGAVLMVVGILWLLSGAVSMI